MLVALKISTPRGDTLDLLLQAAKAYVRERLEFVRIHRESEEYALAVAHAYAEGIEKSVHEILGAEAARSFAQQLEPELSALDPAYKARRELRAANGNLKNSFDDF